VEKKGEERLRKKGGREEEVPPRQLFYLFFRGTEWLKGREERSTKREKGEKISYPQLLSSFSSRTARRKRKKEGGNAKRRGKKKKEKGGGLIIRVIQFSSLSRELEKKKENTKGRGRKGDSPPTSSSCSLAEKGKGEEVRASLYFSYIFRAEGKLIEGSLHHLKFNVGDSRKEGGR